MPAMKIQGNRCYPKSIIASTVIGRSAFRKPSHISVAFLITTLVNINTNSLLYYVQCRHDRLVASMEIYITENNSIPKNTDDDTFDSEILHTRHGYRLLSPFDDFIYCGEHLSDICLYDYISMFYKERSSKGIQFDHGHPQANTHSQILRKSSQQVPNLLG